MTFFLSLLESFPCGLLVHKGNQDKIRLQREHMSNICQIKFALQTSGDKKKTLFYPFWTAWLIISNLQLQEISLIRYICCRKDATNQIEDTHYWAIPLKLDHFTDYDMTQMQLQTDEVQVLAWPDADACGRASRRSLHFYPSELVKPRQACITEASSCTHHIWMKSGWLLLSRFVARCCGEDFEL